MLGVTNEWRDKMPKQLMLRPGFGKAGKSHKVNINSHKVEQWPNKDVHQYDVSHSKSCTHLFVDADGKQDSHRVGG